MPMLAVATIRRPSIDTAAGSRDDLLGDGHRVAAFLHVFEQQHELVAPKRATYRWRARSPQRARSP